MGKELQLKDSYGCETEIKVKQGTLIVTQNSDMVCLDKSEALKLAEFILKTYNND